MATPWTHAVFALAAGNSAIRRKVPLRFWLITATCAAISDIDVFWQRLLSDRSGIWAHRGVSHSLLAAVLFGLVAACVGRAWGLAPGAGRDGLESDSEGRARRLHPTRAFLLLWLAFTLATASHAMLDMLSAGYRGVELLAPFSAQRYAFPWQPIWNIPPWAERMFPTLLSRGPRQAWVLRAALDEIVVVWIPMTALVVFSRLARLRKRVPVPVKVTE
jgi:inner membrane protein